MIRRPPRSTRTDTLFPYTTLFRSREQAVQVDENSTLSRMAPGSPVADPLAVLRSPKLAKFLQAAAQQYDLVCLDAPPVLAVRSEEHTSELQSLMRLSYAVFCLQKNTLPPQKTSLLTTTYTSHTHTYRT